MEVQGIREELGFKRKNYILLYMKNLSLLMQNANNTK
jgi:hypothetical protein